MFIWLKESALKRIQELKFAGKLAWGERCKVESDDLTGKLRLCIWSDPWSPAARIPEVPQELISSVTEITYVYDSPLTPGEYLLNGATLMADYDMAPNGKLRLQVDIRGPSIASVCDIYRSFRSGKLTPTVAYETKGAPEADEDPEMVESGFDED